MKNWQIQETDANLQLMAKTLGISEIAANVMANRNLRSKNTSLNFLRPTLDRLHDPMLLKGAKEAVARITTAINAKEKTVIYGDYDADGVMSTAIMYKLLARLGADVSYYIPHRQEEGYGLNKAAIEKLSAQGTRLIIAVDNGISAAAEVRHAGGLGIDIVMIDHHEEGDALPPAVAIVDPKQSGCEYPFKELCAAGLAYKMAAAICLHMNTPFEEHDELLVFAAIATLCDIVTLTDENRIIVNNGLTVLNANKLINPGLGSLITLRGYLEKPIDSFGVGFVLGPCINSSGRLESAELSVELLLTQDFTRRMELAHRLQELNDSRKNLTTECVERVMENLDPSDKVLVIIDEIAHESVAGIVAGRIRDATGRPTILLTPGEGAMKGSGRSIPGYNLYEALHANQGLFTRFGGHEMAAGLTLPPENIPILREALNRNCPLTDEAFTPVILVDRELNPDDVTLKLSDELSMLSPFGKGNDEPTFLSRNLIAENVRVLDEKNTLIFTLLSPGGRKIKAIAFGLNEIFHQQLPEAKSQATGGILMDAVYIVETNVYNGTASVQMRLRDFVIK
ncbi:MAG: single-stranded-DNA-specific exonuclease RecJ [Defluviitaleaceae bacterium]|nr:single-stranded-DNA-specific exonuclease RecJ [Defluviitaleaceae bacterium]